MPYHVGEKGSYGCSGYPAVKDDGTVMGCHKTAEEAANQIYAINQSEGNIEAGVGIKNPQEWPKPMKSDYERLPKKRRRRSVGGVGGNPSGAVVASGGSMGTKAEGEIKEGDFVMGETTEGVVHGVVEHIMWEGGTLGTPGSEYAIESMPPENPAMSVRVYEEDMDDEWVPTAYSIGMMYRNATAYDMEDHDMSDEEMEYLNKQESYSPNAGMKSAARRALKWKEDGKAKGAGTPVGWGRASDIVAGRSMSLSVVKRMYSFFSRHEVDKQGKGFYDGPNFPSKGRVMWDAWGGNAGFSWSRSIVKRNEEKALFADFGKDYTKATRLSNVFKSYDKDEDEMDKATSVRVGQSVSWNSSGGRASGKVKRIIRSGSYDVPGTDVTINATEENPAVVIELESGQLVAHRMSSLRAS